MMVKGKNSTDHERKQIKALSKTGMSSCTVALKIVRPKTVASNFLKLKENFGKKNAGGRSKALSLHDEGRVYLW